MFHPARPSKKEIKLDTDFPDAVLEPEFLTAWEKVKPFTMTSRARGYALWQAVHHVLDQDIRGALVECGVWRGGSAMLMILAIQAKMATGARPRNVVLFDTFDGMTEPGPQDQDLQGSTAAELMQGSKGQRVAELVQARASLDEVRAAVAATGYDMRLVRLVAGDVRSTLHEVNTLGLALLRLDTDFYDSTMTELQVLYPRLAEGGLLIVDDYGHWQGCRKAVDAYFNENSDGYRRPMFWAVDYTGRAAVKLEKPARVEMSRYDYIPPGMETPNLLPHFPQAKVGNAWSVAWPYLRKHVPHRWRIDGRHTGHVTGYASLEEAACLYHVAQQFAGKRALEIGSHYGWTAAHLLVAGVDLDCVDPAFSIPEIRSAVDSVLNTVRQEFVQAGDHQLWAGLSPDILAEAYEANGCKPWSMAFIDGNHDGDAPAADARAVLPMLAEDAAVMFHDLTSPHVEAGLRVFRDAGFKTLLLNTAQVLGLAWRGKVVPPDHKSDPNVGHLFFSHLEGYSVSPELEPFEKPTYI